MPNMANVTIKKWDLATDQVLTAVAPASGEGGTARWRAEGTATAPAFMPTVEVSTRFNGPKTARRIDLSIVFPYAVTDVNTGLTRVVDRCVFKNGSLVVPLAVPQTVANEFNALVFGFISSPMWREIVKSGYAPN